METPARCLSCTLGIEKIIDAKDYDVDETPDRYGIANGALIICASCLRELEVPVILTRCSGCAFGLIKLVSPVSFSFEGTPKNHGVNMGSGGILCGNCMRNARDIFIKAER